MTNANAWYKKYNKEINDLEDKLAAFTALKTPTEFNHKFEDLFGKKTMPVIKTDGDIHANAVSAPSSWSGKLGNTQASEFYALGDAAYNEWQEYTEDSARGQWIKK